MMSRISHRAFTLIEILMVVVILGIAGAVIVPQIGSRDDLKAAAAARIITADLIYAQNLAITKQSSYFVSFSPASKQHSLLDGATMSTITHPITKNPYVMSYGASGSPGFEAITLVSADILGASGTSYGTIGFDELGTPLVYPGANPAQTMTSGNVVIQCGSYKLKITIESFTGQITVAKAP